MFSCVRHYMQSPVDTKFRSLLQSQALWCTALHSMFAGWPVPINPSKKEKLKEKSQRPLPMCYEWGRHQPWQSSSSSFWRLLWLGDQTLTFHTTGAHLCYAPSNFTIVCLNHFSYHKLFLMMLFASGKLQITLRF